MTEETAVQPLEGTPAPAESKPAAPVPEPGKPLTAQLAQVKSHLQQNQYLASLGDFTAWGEKLVEYEGKKDKLVEIPGADATDEVKLQFRTKVLGVPAKPEDYKFTPPVIPKELGINWNTEAEAGFKKFMHQLGVPNDVADKLLAFDTSRVVQGAQGRLAAQKAAKEAQDAQVKANLSELQKEWGQEFDAKSARAKGAMEKTTSEEFRKLLGERGLLDHPLTARHFLDIDGAVGEGEFLRGGRASTPKAPEGLAVISDKVRASIGLPPRGR